jgi:pyruvate/2-oxoglutarate/acetoin dehydrogenase E1 component
MTRSDATDAAQAARIIASAFTRYIDRFRYLTHLARGGFERADWPDVQPYFVPIGEAKLCRTGTHATVVSYARTLPLCLQAADHLAAEGLSFDVIDLRTLYPVDMPALRRSLAKTHRLLVVNEQDLRTSA